MSPCLSVCLFAGQLCLCPHPRVKGKDVGYAYFVTTVCTGCTSHGNVSESPRQQADTAFVVAGVDVASTFSVIGATRSCLCA